MAWVNGSQSCPKTSTKGECLNYWKSSIYSWIRDTRKTSNFTLSFWLCLKKKVEVLNYSSSKQEWYSRILRVVYWKKNGTIHFLQMKKWLSFVKWRRETIQVDLTVVVTRTRNPDTNSFYSQWPCVRDPMTLPTRLLVLPSTPWLSTHRICRAYATCFPAKCRVHPTSCYHTYGVFPYAKFRMLKK